MVLVIADGGWWRWALVSPHGVAPSQMVCVSASVNCTLYHNVQKFSSGTGSPGWSQKKVRKTVVLWCGALTLLARCPEEHPASTELSDEVLAPRHLLLH